MATITIVWTSQSEMQQKTLDAFSLDYPELAGDQIKLVLTETRGRLF